MNTLADVAALMGLPAQTESQAAYSAAGGDLAMATALRWGIPVRPHKTRPAFKPNRADRRRHAEPGSLGIYTRSLLVHPEVVGGE